MKIKVRDCNKASTPWEFYLEQTSETQIALRAKKVEDQLCWTILWIDAEKRCITRALGTNKFSDVFDIHKGMIKMDTD